MSARYLLDVNLLLALLWEDHEHNKRAWKWLDKEGTVASCPMTEMGFLRISTQPVYGATVEQARKMLRDWKAAKTSEFIPVVAGTKLDRDGAKLDLETEQN